MANAFRYERGPCNSLELYLRCQVCHGLWRPKYNMLTNQLDREVGYGKQDRKLGATDIQGICVARIAKLTHGPS